MRAASCTPWSTSHSALPHHPSSFLCLVSAHAPSHNLTTRTRDHCSDVGSGHLTVGASQQDRLPAGCVLFGSRHKYNANSASKVECSDNAQCVCAGDCAPLPALVSAQPVLAPRGTCDPTALSQTRLDVITATCCGADGADAAACDVGLPDACSARCAAVYMPLFSVCGTELEASLGPAARSFAGSCPVYCCPRSPPACMALADPGQTRALVAACADESLGFRCPVATSAVGLGPLECWDTSCAVDFRGMFRSATTFDADIGGWDTSAVYTMEMMFQGASSFNHDIGAWDVRTVTSMAMMFYGASSFNRDISAWDVSSVTTTRMMFSRASSFDQDLSAWSVWAVTDMSRMFYASAQSTRMRGDAWSAQSGRNVDGMYDSSCCTSSQHCAPGQLRPSPSPTPLLLCDAPLVSNSGH